MRAIRREGTRALLSSTALNRRSISGKLLMMPWLVYFFTLNVPIAFCLFSSFTISSSISDILYSWEKSVNVASRLFYFVRHMTGKERMSFAGGIRKWLVLGWCQVDARRNHAGQFWRAAVCNSGAPLGGIFGISYIYTRRPIYFMLSMDEAEISYSMV